MDTTLIIVAASAVVFGLLPLVLRSNAAALFLTLCAGAVVSKLVAQDLTQIMSSIIPNSNIPMFTIVQIALLVVAPIVLLFGLKGSVKKSGLLWQLVPTVATAVLAIYFITPMLNYDTSQQVLNSNIYGIIKPYFSLAAAAGLLASVLQLWSLKPKKHDEKHSKKKHK